MKPTPTPDRPKYWDTQSDLRRHLRQTRDTRVRNLCNKYGTTSYSEALTRDTVDLCHRIQIHTDLHNTSKALEQATIAGDFALGEKLSRQIQRLKAKL
jgi:hypothetical protein